jgi:RHS repeat-associated protein
LGGSLEAAGGIGGLLARTDHRLLAIGDTAAHSFYHSDGNGNVTSLVNAAQELVAKYIYDPFGTILAASGALAEANLYRFSSKELHINSGTYYYLYRFYDPNLQRWVNKDPGEERGGTNPYEFVKNDSMNRFDALGLIDCFRLCSQICADALKDPTIDKSGGGGVICNGKQQCPCYFGLPGAPPGACPELEKIVTDHETSHLGESAPCDPSKPPYRDSPAPGVDRKAAECRARKQSLKDLSAAIPNASGACKDAMQNVMNDMQRWVDKNCSLAK